ncbi:cofactor-independent phosphoglycerate mutase [Thermodesulfobacteriota bacterium B35]
MKYVMLVGDGMGDMPVPELSGRTPLAAARTPAMDALARRGELLLVRTVPEGFPPGSDVANLSLLGYDPRSCYTGRAPLEAASMGVEIGPDELAFRCNLVTLDFHEDGTITMLDYSAGHISSDEGTRLVRAIQERCGTGSIRLYPGISYRHLLILRGETPQISTVPPHDHMDRDVTAYYARYLEAGSLGPLMECAHSVLADHPVNRERIRRGLRPANAIWLWGEGGSPAMETLAERFGLSGSLVSAVDLLKGIGILSGLDVPDVEGATGYLDTNYEGKVQAALAALAKGDFVLIHVEAPDEAGHQGLLADKIRAIEDFDARIVAPMVRALEAGDEPFRLVVTMDHYTPLSRRTHEDWPVPMLLYDSGGVARASGRPYTEADAREAVAASGLELASGTDFFRYFIRGGEEGHG